MMPKELSHLAKMAGTQCTRPYSTPGGASSKPAGAFLSLKSSMASSLIDDEDVVVIRDKYPKAKYHFLILPKSKYDPDHLQNVTSFTPKHIPLVEHLVKVAGSLMAKEAPGVAFQTGFHSIPSMNPLHMHVISTDFDSPSLKNKKHWNTFTTEFFLHADWVLSKLKTDGKITIDRQRCEELTKRPLACRWCGGTTFKTIPELKIHLLTSGHKQNLIKS